MHKSHELSKSAMGQLKSWLQVHGGVGTCLTAPKELSRMTERNREETQSRDRTQAASRIVQQHLHHNTEFTGIITMVADPSSSTAVEDYCRAVRKALAEIQVSHWNVFASKNNVGKVAA